MKQFYILMFLLVCSFGEAQVINFPDANFKAKLLMPGTAYDWSGESIVIDVNNDGEIQVGEAQAVIGLNVSNANISDLTGISFFTSLMDLDCGNNLLSTLVIDDAIALNSLKADHNALTSVTVNFSSSVAPILNLSYNNLTSYSIQSNVYYDTLNLSHNQLTNLVIGDDVTIDYFSVENNNLSSLELMGNIMIFHSINFRNNQFSLLDLAGFSFNNECTLTMGNNVVDKVVGSFPGNIILITDNTFADFGNFGWFTSCQPEYQGHLTIANCPNLEYFSLKNGLNHTYITCTEGSTVFDNPALGLNISNCPNLSFICVDEGEKPYIQESIEGLGLQNQVEVNSYCTFTPGGLYYTVSGATRLDADFDGCDAENANVPFQKFTISNGSQSATVISDESGNYAIPVGPGSHIVTPIIDNPELFTISPASVSVNFPLDTSPAIQNFCITASGVHPDLEISLIPITPARPGFDATYKILLENNGNQVQSGSVHLAFEEAILDFISSIPSVTMQATGIVTWEFINLQPFESREITIVMNVNSPMETPPVNGGDQLVYTASVASDQTDDNPADNTASLNQTVVNSFDPNDKTCLEGNLVGPEMIGQYVHYVVRFENTGTANAQNIVVSDMIDTTKFDIATLMPIDASHPFTTRITLTNKVEFIFENINLPFDDANNDGYVAFKIKTKPTLVVGDTFSNTASIYFDYNFPIVTNTATTAIQLLGNSDFEFANEFALYPNPVQNVLNIRSKNGVEMRSASIYNVLGQVLMTVTDLEYPIDVTQLQSGNYFIKVYSDKGNAISKFIKY